MNVRMGDPDEAFFNPRLWFNHAVYSVEQNRGQMAYRIASCEVICEGTSVTLDSVSEIDAVCRMSSMIKFLTAPNLFITKDGAVGVGDVPIGTPVIDRVILPVAYNIDKLTAPDVNYFIHQKHVPGMTLCMVDMASFCRELNEGRNPALLITRIGFLKDPQSRE